MAAVRRAVWQHLGLHPRLLLAAALVAVLMVPVGVLVAAIGVFALEVSGGAARDTSIVVGVAGFVVADFWGAGIVTALTRARAAQVTVAWTIARGVVLLLIALVLHRTAPVAPIQLAIAVPAAWAGARTGRKQAALRRAASVADAADAASGAAARAAEDASRDPVR